ncbi:MAG: hypothetical protein ACFFC7_25730 [Candidatus Hermodarchaeota archaeon]
MDYPGTYTYLADYLAGLDIYDLSTPSPPMKVEQFDDEGSAYDVVISGPYAYSPMKMMVWSLLIFPPPPVQWKGAKFDVLLWYEMQYK